MKKHENEASDVHYKGKAVPRMLAYARPQLKAFLVVILLTAILTALELYRPIITGDAIDDFITGEGTLPEGVEMPEDGVVEGFEPGVRVDERFKGVLLAAVKYVVVLAGFFVCDRFSYILISKTGQKIIFQLRGEIFEHIETLTMRFFDLTPVGKIVTRVTNDVENMNEFFSYTLVTLFKSVVKIIGLAVIMLLLNVKMALWSFALLPIVFVMTLIFQRVAHRIHREVKTKVTTINTFLSENISGMKVIQIFGREKEKYDEFAEKDEDLYRSNKKEMLLGAIFRPSTNFLSNVALVIVLLAGSRNVLSGAISIGTLYIFTQYIRSFFEPIQDLAEQFTFIQSAIASAEKIFTLLDEEPLIKDPENPKTLPEIKGKIEFKHVWFAYNNEDYVLRDVSFTIEPGQRVAFVGATGAGKSSILNLIGRYYDIQKGEILIDGVNIKELTRDQIRSAIGQVQQDVFIFTGDIRSNIRLRNEEITDEAIEAASVHVNASRFIDRLPSRYDEKVSERGSTFSAGQRQLLSFARTLAFDPKILILDEATANIDTETELWIQEALERLMQGRTTIMVAHRLSTIQHADKIIVMHKGKIRESGTHQELLEQNGIYKKLYQLQLA